MVGWCLGGWFCARRAAPARSSGVTCFFCVTCSFFKLCRLHRPPGVARAAAHPAAWRRSWCAECFMHVLFWVPTPARQMSEPTGTAGTPAADGGFGAPPPLAPSSSSSPPSQLACVPLATDAPPQRAPPGEAKSVCVRGVKRGREADSQVGDAGGPAGAGSGSTTVPVESADVRPAEPRAHPSFARGTCHGASGPQHCRAV